MSSISFQFPSNGKGFPNTSGPKQIKQHLRKVSIPFKRERLSEQAVSFCHMLDYEGFNSLQTGKAFRTSNRGHTTRNPIIVFNSLQTGKAFRTHHGRIPERTRHQVSIPFKRERLSELTNCYNCKRCKGWFQFPSNGKGFPNGSIRVVRQNRWASFNSLQTGKAFRTNNFRENIMQARQLFQFPSNGKGFPNLNGKP